MDNLFETDDKLLPEKEYYTQKIKAPIYTPSSYKPYINDLFLDSKSKKLIAKIKNSTVSQEEKEFLILAAYRHIVFNYTKIADYYAHSNKEMQELMESSALVLIDFNKAIQEGYAKVYDDISEICEEDNG